MDDLRETCSDCGLVADLCCCMRDQEYEEEAARVLAEMARERRAWALDFGAGEEH